MLKLNLIKRVGTLKTFTERKHFLSLTSKKFIAGGMTLRSILEESVAWVYPKALVLLGNYSVKISLKNEHEKCHIMWHIV